MKSQFRITIDGRVAGNLEINSAGKSRFDYCVDSSNDNYVTPLSLSMPRQVLSHPDGVVTSWFQRLYSRSSTKIDNALIRSTDTASSLRDWLLTTTNQDLLGSIEIAPQMSNSVTSPSTNSNGVVETRDIARYLKMLDSQSEGLLDAQTIKEGKLPGNWGKLSLYVRGETFYLPSSKIPSTHIIKPLFDAHGEEYLNQYLCLQAARNVGLLAVKTSARKLDGVLTFIHERYDRRVTVSDVQRIHQEGVDQALSLVSRNDTSQLEISGSMATLALLERSMPSRYSRMDKERYVDYLIWHWITAYTDARPHNYALLLSGSQVRLGPLFDSRTSLVYSKRRKRIRFSSLIGGEDKLFPSASPWQRAAREFRMEADYLLGRVKSLALLAPDGFSDAVRGLADVGNGSNLPTKIVDEIATRSKWCLKLLDAHASDTSL